MHWFPFYSSDFLGATVGLSCLERSLYALMIPLYYEVGPFPAERIRVYRIVGCESDEQKRAVDYLLQTFFVLLEDGWYQERAEKVRNEQAAISDQAKAAANARWSKRTDNSGNADAMRTHSASNANQSQSQNQNQTHNQTKLPIPPDGGMSSRPAAENVPYGRIVDLYHELLPELPRVVKLTEARKAQIRARWKGKDAEDLDDWKSYFLLVKESRFLTGLAAPSNGRKVFRADLEWLVKESNFTKVLEGRYE